MKCTLGIIIALFVGMAHADTVTTKSGGNISCTVLQEGSTSVTVRIGYGTVVIPREMIESIRKEVPAATSPTTSPANQSRIPSYSTVVSVLLRQNWSTNFQQIPATVIDKGVLRHVPYQSYRCAENYEINVYGDPDAPAGIEIGVYRTLLNDTQAKRNCVEFIASLLPRESDRAALRLLDLNAGRIVLNGMSFEVTPETAEDAYGGWWVSVYDEKSIEAARASEKELAQIAVPRVAQSSQSTLARQPASAEPLARTNNADSLTQWTRRDMGYARPSINRSAQSASSGGGSVYVRGYYRKDGTYVQAHTRRSPRR